MKSFFVHPLASCPLALCAAGALFFTAAPAQAGLIFSTKVDNFLGYYTYPSAVAIADYNGDGNLDFAATEQGNKVAILLGRGDGTFGTKTEFGTGTTPKAIASGDFNRDGKADLVVCNQDANTVSVLIGNGAGGFAAKVDYATGTTPYALTVGDLNRDGNPDVAVANIGGNTVSILLGTGTGTFAAKTDYATGAGPTSVAISDLNRDSIPDLVTANTQGHSVSVLLGQGNGGFASKMDTVVGTTSVNPQTVVAGDFNHDSKPDIAVSNFTSPNTILVLPGQGDGTLGARAEYPIDGAPSAMAMADLDRDGNLDLLVTISNMAPNHFSVLLGRSDGSFAPAVSFNTGQNPLDIGVGDFNRDGTPDVATVDNSDNAIAVLLNNAVPSATISSQTQAEGNSGSANMVFTVTLSTASGQSTSLNYTVGGGSATSGTDYGAAFDSDGGTPGTLVIPAGSLSGTITVPILGDTTYEADETFNVSLSNPSNATVGSPGVGVGTITNDDAAPNDPPVVDLNGTNAGIDNTVSYVEDSTTIALRTPLIASAALVSDDSTTPYNIYSMTVKITNLKDGASETLSSNTTGTMISASYDATTGELYLRGGDTSANFQKVLRTVRYRNSSQNPDTTSRVISVVAEDLQGARSPVAKTTVSVTATNDAPQAIVPTDATGNPAAQTVNEDTPLTLSVANNNLIGVVDRDDAGQVEEVQISVLHGTLTLKQTTGLTFTQGSGTNNAAMTFRGTIPIETNAQGQSVPGGTVGHALDGLVYTPDPNYNGSDTLTLSINDLGNTGTGGPLSASATLPLSVSPVNDAPVNSVPSTATTPRDTALVFNTANGNRFSIADVDAGTGALSVTLSARNGTINLGTTPTNATVSGNGTATVTLSGTLSDLNAALDGLSFVPTAGYSGSDASLTIVTNDGGNTGGTALSDTDVVPVQVLAPGASSVLISQFRLSGPGGAGDEFIEIYNNTSAPLNLNGWTLQAGAASVSLSGKTVPDRGHVLVTGNSYSLNGSASGDITLAPGTDIAPGATLKLSDPSGAVTDTVNSNGVLVPGGGFNQSQQYAFVRRFETGLPASSGGDASDFNLASIGVSKTNSDTSGTATLDTTGRLGAPGPRNLSSPIQRNNRITYANLAASATVKYSTTGGTLDPNGQLSLRRTITNKGAQTATRMRFRIAAITAGTSATATAADLRALGSRGVTVMINGQAQQVNALALEGPSDATGNGGGLNSTWSVDLTQATLSNGSAASASGGVPTGQSINVEFLFGIVRGGTYRVVIDTELLP